MKYDAVIFDKDGVLIDSTEIGFEWEHRMRARLINENGGDVDFEKAAELVEANRPEELREFMKQHDLSWKKLGEIEEKVADRKIERVRNGDIGLLKSTRDVLQRLDAKKAVLSNAPLKATNFVMEYYSLEKYFEKVVSPETSDMESYIRKRKPSTDMLDEILEEINSSNPLMVGDSASDVKLADNAGLDCCLVNPYRPYPELNPKYKFETLEKIQQISKLDFD